jgi:LuxR family maltose regulon positive regulatory protein
MHAVATMTEGTRYAGRFDGERGDARAVRAQLPMSEAEFILKSTPPRVPRTAYRRERLLRLWDVLRERAAIALVAPRGFGKTTLLSQWRLAWLERGERVAWLGADEQDDPPRFAAALEYALHGALGRAADRPAGPSLPTERPVEALTRLLAQVAAVGGETVLIVDEAERLPQDTVRLALAYVLRNAPANLHVVLASRVPVVHDAWDLAATGALATVGLEDLRLRQDEANAILDRRFADRLTPDQRARLHTLADGWPIGLQLAAATIEREPDLDRAIDALSGRGGDIARYFIEALLARLPPPLADFLVRVAILEHLDAPLCAAITHCEDAAAHLEHLMRETPIIAACETDGTYRLHPLARDFLLAHFEQLPREERDALHCRAFHWFARQDRYHEAACHALAADDEPAAHAHAARALWTLGTQGRLAEAGAWLERLPREALAGDTELQLIAAWIEAFGERNHESLATALRVLDDPASTPRLRVIASRVASGAAAYADRIGLIPRVLRGLPDARAVIDDPLYVLAMENTKALVDLHAGDTASVRRRVDRPPPPGDQRSLPLALAYSRMLVGASHLWDGDSARAEAVMRPALEDAERQGERRGAVACLLASVLASAVIDRDRPDEAEALLADRLDVIERMGIPEMILFAYRTLVHVAMGRGDERRALHLLANLRRLAGVRALPRLAMHALGEEARLHAQAGRPQAAAAAVEALEALAPGFAHPDFAPFDRRYRETVAIARVHEALGRRDLDAAEAQLTVAEDLATQLRRGRDTMILSVLRAVIARQRHHGNALPLLGETLSLGALHGRDRLLAETHPLAVKLGAELADARTAPAPAPVASRAATPSPAAPARSGPLTPKEADVLRLLGAGLSNKLIARALEVSDETVKWHLKNLYLKLSAGTRKHAVDRAKLLGLLAS